MEPVRRKAKHEAEWLFEQVPPWGVTAFQAGIASSTLVACSNFFL